MDKIIQILNDDKTCQGYLIVSLDGTIIDSSGKLEQKASLAQSMCKIFYSLNGTGSTPRVVFQNENGHVMAYKNRGQIVVVQKSENPVYEDQVLID